MFEILVFGEVNEVNRGDLLLLLLARSRLLLYVAVVANFEVVAAIVDATFENFFEGVSHAHLVAPVQSLLLKWLALAHNLTRIILLPFR